MSLLFSLLTFLSPFILISLLPKSLPETAYIVAVYLILLPFAILSSFFLSKSKLSTINYKLLIIFMFFYSLYLFSMSLARYYNFRSEIIDLSYYDHVLYQLSQFKIPKVWDVPQWFVWGDHFDAILLLFVPLYWLKREPAILMAIQSGFAILTTIPIYLYAKNKFENCIIENSLKIGAWKLEIKLLAISLSFAYLLFSPHQMGYLYGFHEIVIFPFFFFWTLHFLEVKKYKLFFLFLFLTTIIKEETFMYLFFLGVYYFLKLKILKLFRICNFDIGIYKIPLVFITTGVLWYLFTFHLIFPHFYPHWDIHRGLYSDISTNLLQPYKIGTILNHLIPLSPFSLLFPISLIVTLPAWLQKLLTNDIASLSGFHYSSALTALIIFASIEALCRLIRKNYLRNLSHVSYFVIFSAFYSNFFLGYQPSSLKNLSFKEFLPTPGQQTAYDFMKEIPGEASVSASYILVPHLKKPTGQIHAVPRNNEDSEYVLLNHNISIPLTTASLYKHYLAGLEKNYEIIKSKDNVFLLKSTLDKHQ